MRSTGRTGGVPVGTRRWVRTLRTPKASSGVGRPPNHWRGVVDANIAVRDLLGLATEVVGVADGNADVEVLARALSASGPTVVA